MPNKNYDRGYALENRLVNSLLVKHRFIYAARIAGSHSVADVVGITPNGITIFFQCKSTEKDFIQLTNIFRDDNVMKLRELPEQVRKVLVIKEGLNKRNNIHFFRWFETEQRWITFNFKI